MQRLIPASGLALALAYATPGAAQTPVTEIPDYFIDEVVAAATAERVANFCPTLSVNPLTGRERSVIVFEQLSADGISPSDLPEGTGAAEIEAQTSAFVEKHGLQEPTVETICAAGRAEMSEGTVIGLYLVEVEE